MLYRFLPLVVSLLTIWVTTWISLLPLNGVSQADISNKYLTPITPAWFTFSIWSLIYLSWIIVWVLIALKKIEVGKKQKVVFSMAIALTALWLLPWHYEKIYQSLIVMFMILAWLSYLFVRAQKKEVPSAWKWMIELTIGWIIVASLVNLAVYIVSKWIVVEFQTMTLLSLLGLFIGAMIQWAILNGFKSYIPVFVYIWALWWIYNGESIFSIKITALGFAIILLCNFIYVRRKSYQRVLIENFSPSEKSKTKKKK